MLGMADSPSKVRSLRDRVTVPIPTNGTYMTDGARLYLIIAVLGDRALVENCATGWEAEHDLSSVAKWRKVQPGGTA